MSFLVHVALLALWYYTKKHPLIVPPAASPHPSPITLNLSRFQPARLKPSTTAPKPPVPTPPTPTPATKPLRAKPTPAKPARQHQPSSATSKRPVVHKSSPKTQSKRPNKAPTKQRTPTPKPKTKRTQTHKPKHRPTRTAKARSGLAGALLKHARPTRSRSNSSAAMIKALYGKAYYRMSKTQRRFIKDRLHEIQRITQNTLVRNGYPEVAVRTRQEGVNVVSFYLHPNGDISDLRLLRPMGYEVLDQNTLEVIRIAYKDYPRPKEKTKIIFYVNYRLY